MAFVKSARKIITMKSGKVTLITVGNKRTGEHEEDDDFSPCEELKWAIDDAIDAFGNVFESAAVVELDCNKPHSVSMAKLRCQIKQIREECVEVCLG